MHSRTVSVIGMSASLVNKSHAACVALRLSAGVPHK